MARTRRRGAEDLIGRIEAARALDAPGYAIGNALARPAQIAGRPARRLGGPRLREIGHALERLLEDCRTSRARQAFRALKVRLLEGT